MPGKPVSILFLIFILIFLICFNNMGQLPDRKLQEKYGLIIPPPDEKIDPAPEWLRKADMFTSGRGVWKDHKFILKDTSMTRIVRIRAGNGPVEITEHYPVETIGSFDGSSVKGVSLISHVPHSKKVFEEAHKQGFKVIPYVHFTDIHSFYADQDVFLFQHPEILLKDKDGRWVHLPMDGSDRAFRYLTCANSPSYWRLSLDYVRKMMDWGADGVFIDNVGGRKECFGPKYNVPDGSSARNPEFPPYLHEHLFPDTTHSYAWDRLLQVMRDLVKSYGEDKIVVLNSGIGTPFQKNGDCCMWESFIYSWAWEGRRHTWQDVKKRAQDNNWFLNTGRRITALSSINPKRSEAKDDAFWAFSAARLVDFIWWADLNGTGAEILYRAHMGGGLGPFTETNGLIYRSFENGIIVLNDSDYNQNAELPILSGSRSEFLLDLFNGSKPVRIKNKKLRITVPGKTARVYLLP
jgi:hypothetical protein